MYVCVYVITGFKLPSTDPVSLCFACRVDHYTGTEKQWPLFLGPITFSGRGVKWSQNPTAWVNFSLIMTERDLKFRVIVTSLKKNIKMA